MTTVHNYMLYIWVPMGKNRFFKKEEAANLSQLYGSLLPRKSQGILLPSKTSTEAECG